MSTCTAQAWFGSYTLDVRSQHLEKAAECFVCDVDDMVRGRGYRHLAPWMVADKALLLARSGPCDDFATCKQIQRHGLAVPAKHDKAAF